MSWFSNLAGAFQGEDGSNGQAGYDSSGSAIRTETNASGVPRPKAPAKGKLLHKFKYEVDSDSSDEGELRDDMSDTDPASPISSRHMSPATPAVGPDMDEEATAAAVKKMAPLESFEQKVLQLRDPRKQAREQQEETKDGPELEHEAKKTLNDLKLREKLLEEEKSLKELDQKHNSNMGVNALSASRVIVGVAKVKLNMMKQKMKLYEEAENQGTDANLRARKLLTWVAALSFLKRFDDKFHEPDINELKRREYLEKLEPPPPPPPAEEPPDSEDEELHDKYEAMIRRYESQWTKEGHKVLGKEKFREIQNWNDPNREGPAKREKKNIAKDCEEKAKHVMNETEYQELLRKAWRLQDDHADLKDYQPDEFIKKLAPQSGSKSSR